MSDLLLTPDAAQDAPLPRGVRIVTGSRLHFGLLDTVAPFGGVGVMIDQPQTEVIVSPSGHFEFREFQEREFQEREFQEREHYEREAQKQRVCAIAKRVAELAGLGDELSRYRIVVSQSAPSHCGLGSGTQLSLAVAEGVCRVLGVQVDHETLATRIAQRGRRSAVGIHGYFRGGLIYERGSHGHPLQAIRQRVELPDDWYVVILRPMTSREQVHGVEELERFATLGSAGQTARRMLLGILRSELMPAAVAGDFQSFSYAVQRYNRASGMLFAPIQGGPYNGASIDAVIDWLIDRGVVGVGQSSWGPGVFAWFPSRCEAEQMVDSLPDDIDCITLTRACNRARSLEDLGAQAAHEGIDSV